MTKRYIFDIVALFVCAVIIGTTISIRLTEPSAPALLVFASIFAVIYSAVSFSSAITEYKRLKNKLR